MKRKLLITCLLLGILLLFPYQTKAAIASWPAISKDSDTISIVYQYEVKDNHYQLASMHFEKSNPDKNYTVMFNGENYPFNQEIAVTDRIDDKLEENYAEIIGTEVFPLFYKNESVLPPAYQDPSVKEFYVAERDTASHKIFYYGLHKIKSWTPALGVDIQDGDKSSGGVRYELYRKDAKDLEEDTQPEEPTKPTESTMDQMEGEWPALQSIQISGASTMAPFTSKKLSVNPVPGDALLGKITWKSSNRSYATVSSKGLVKAKKAGAGKTVTITATVDGKKATHKIKINGLVKKIKLSCKKAKAKKYQDTVLNGCRIGVFAKIKSGKNANKKLKWKVSNSKYASIFFVSDDTHNVSIRAKKAGKGKTIKVTAMATDGSKVKATKKIKIK